MYYNHVSIYLLHDRSIWTYSKTPQSISMMARPIFNPIDRNITFCWRIFHKHDSVQARRYACIVFYLPYTRTIRLSTYGYLYCNMVKIQWLHQGAVRVRNPRRYMYNALVLIPVGNYNIDTS